MDSSSGKGRLGKGQQGQEKGKDASPPQNPPGCTLLPMPAKESSNFVHSEAKDGGLRRHLSSKIIGSIAEFQGKRRFPQHRSEKQSEEIISRRPQSQPGRDSHEARLPSESFSRDPTTIHNHGSTQPRSTALRRHDVPVPRLDPPHPIRGSDLFDRRGSATGSTSAAPTVVTNPDSGSQRRRSFDQPSGRADPHDESPARKRGREELYASHQRRQYRRLETDSLLGTYRVYGDDYLYHASPRFELRGHRCSTPTDIRVREHYRRDSYYPPPPPPPPLRAIDRLAREPRRISDAGSSSSRYIASRTHSGSDYDQRLSPLLHHRKEEFWGDYAMRFPELHSNNLYIEGCGVYSRKSECDTDERPRTVRSAPTASKDKKMDCKREGEIKSSHTGTRRSNDHNYYYADLTSVEEVRESFVKNETMSVASEAAKSKPKRQSPFVAPFNEGKRVFDEFEDDCFTQFADIPASIEAAHGGPVPTLELDELLGDLNEMFQEETMETRVKNAHAAIAALLPKDGSFPKLAGAEASLLAHKYYETWAPRTDKPVNLLVLSDSPAYTHPSIVGAYADNIDLVHLGHLNLVHCPSYGESWMFAKQVLSKLDPDSRRSVEKGTKQFWRLLSTLSGEQDGDGSYDPLSVDSGKGLQEIFCHLEKASRRKDEWGPFRSSRVDAKRRVLDAMKDRGIMLADVSPVPLSAASNVDSGDDYKLTEQNYNAIIRSAWNLYARYMVKAHRPKNVLVLGEKLENAIGAANIQQAASEVGGRYLGRMHHPNYGEIQGRKFLPSLRVARYIAQSAASGKAVNLSTS